jgi:16S rRNA (guanine527-N7)-methyltransferase
VSDSAAETVSILAAGLSDWSLDLSSRQAAQFAEYARLLVLWNETRMNLTRITAPRDIAVFHFLDSISVLRVAGVPTGSSLLDIGTGGGFPAIPLKIMRPDLSPTLLEATAKKLEFCREIVRELGLTGVELVHGRAEDRLRLARTGFRKPANAAGFDLVTARAVAPLDKLIGWAAPHVKRPGGMFVAWKGARAKQEMAAAADFARRLQMEMKLDQIALPQSGEPPTAHSLVICRYTGS